MPSTGLAFNSSINACTWKRRFKSSTLGPYSIKMYLSPACRYTTCGVLPCASIRPTIEEAFTGSNPVRCVGSAIGSAATRFSSNASCCNSSASAWSNEIGMKRILSPGLTCPTFHNSALAMVTRQTKPPRLGPSCVRITGMSPVKLTLPTAYSQSWTFEGCKPASPPSLRAHVGFGPIRRTPRRFEL